MRCEPLKCTLHDWKVLTLCRVENLLHLELVVKELLRTIEREDDKFNIGYIKEVAYRQVIS